MGKKNKRLKKTAMKKVPILLLATLLTGCFGSSQSVPQNSSCSQIETSVKLDSIPLTAFEYKMRGNYKADMGDREGALEDYTRAILVNPAYDTAYYNRGLIKYDIGDRDGELADYDKALSINPKYLKVYINRSILKYENNDHDGALSDCKLAIKHCAPDADLHNNHGRFLYDLKRFKESAEAYGDGIKHFPEDYKLYYGRGLARNQSGDKKGACEDWRKSSDLGCFEANALLPLCDDCKTDKTKK